MFKKKPDVIVVTRYKGVINNLEEKVEKGEFKEDKDYNKTMELLIDAKKAEAAEEQAKMKKPVDPNVVISGLNLITSWVGIGAAVFLGIYSYHQDDEMKMSQGKSWNLGNKLLDKFGSKKV